MKRLQLFCIAVALFAFATTVSAQSTSSISGTVTDPSGAVVVKAEVTVHSLGTGVDRVVITDSAGLYVVPSLQPGDYSVKAAAAGFSAYTVPKVTLQVDHAATVNMRLAVSSAGEKIGRAHV